MDARREISMEEEVITTTTTTTVTVRRHMTMNSFRQKHKLPPIKRTWIPKKTAKEMDVLGYVALFCKLNHLKG